MAFARAWETNKLTKIIWAQPKKMKREMFIGIKAKSDNN